jgi:hypothetical protein
LCSADEANPSLNFGSTAISQRQGCLLLTEFNDLPYDCRPHPANPFRRLRAIGHLFDA